MNLVADEGVDKHIVERLREDGHSVWSVAEMSPSISDNEVLQLSQNQSAILLTSDKDFGELVFRKRLISYGVILIRLSGISQDLKSNIVSSIIKQHGDKMIRSFTVISPKSVRIRTPYNQ
ncbi:DUF5615 family PIN-like protein [Candidatus Sumerlaeota bacterium]|nr:DUF5615 family PIN-like protein [Candidatus Sumerlaeota bacterium]